MNLSQEEIKQMINERVTNYDGCDDYPNSGNPKLDLDTDWFGWLVTLPFYVALFTTIIGDCI